MRLRIQSRAMLLMGRIALLVYFALQVAVWYSPYFHPVVLASVRGLALGVALTGLIVGAWKKGRLEAPHRPA